MMGSGALPERSNATSRHAITTRATRINILPCAALPFKVLREIDIERSLYAERFGRVIHGQYRI